MEGRKLEKPKYEQKIAPVQQEEIKDKEVNVEQVLEEQPPEQEEGTEIQEEKQSEEQEEKPEKLYAIYPILFESHQYKVGERLPTTDMKMVEAWIEVEAAIWK